MAFYDRVKVTTPTTGMGAMTFGSAVSGYRSFASIVPDGTTVSYAVEDDGGAWEVGTGVYTLGSNTMTRSVSSSSNAGATIALSGNAKCFITARAADLVTAASSQSISGNVSVGGTLSAGSSIVMTSTAGTSTLSLDAGDGLTLDRANNYLQSFIGGFEIFRVKADGVFSTKNMWVEQSSAAGGETSMRVSNTAPSGSSGLASAKYYLTTSTTNSSAWIELNDGSGTPYVYRGVGAAVATVIDAGDTHRFDTRSGVTKATLDSTGLTIVKAIKPTIFLDKVQSPAASSTQALDLQSGSVFNIAITSNTTITFTNPPTLTGLMLTFQVVTTNNTTAGYSVAFPSAKYAGGLVPNRTTAANAIDVWTFWTFDGTNYYGSLAGKDMK